MDLKYQNKVTKTIVYFIITALTALIQNTSGLTIEIAGARCFLLIPVCIILGMGEDEFLQECSAFSAVFCGSDIGGTPWI